MSANPSFPFNEITPKILRATAPVHGFKNTDTCFIGIFSLQCALFTHLFSIFVLCYKIRSALLLFFWLKRKFSTTYLLVFLTMQDSRTRRLSNFFLFDSVHSSDIRFSYLKITHPFRSFLSAIVSCFSQRRIPGR